MWEFSVTQSIFSDTITLEGRKKDRKNGRNYGGTNIYLRNGVEDVCGPNGELKIAKEDAEL